MGRGRVPWGNAVWLEMMGGKVIFFVFFCFGGGVVGVGGWGGGGGGVLTGACVDTCMAKMSVQ